MLSVTVSHTKYCGSPKIKHFGLEVKITFMEIVESELLLFTAWPH